VAARQRQRDAPVKVIFFNPIGTLGGAEMCLLDVLASLRTMQSDWQLGVVLGDDGPLRRAVEDLGVACRLLPLPRSVARLGDSALGVPESRRAGGVGLATHGPAAALTTTSYLSRFHRLLRVEAPDRLQTNGMKAHVIGAWGAPAGLPVIWHLHDYAGGRPVMARLLRWSARRQVRVVAVSRSVAADARRVLGPRVPIHSIHNAIDLDRFSPGPGDGSWLDAAAGLAPVPRATVRIGLVATFACWKGHDVFLNAAARIPADLPCRFYVVGGAIYRSQGSQYAMEQLRRRAGVLGLDGRLGFTGHVADPAAALRALDIVVHASTRPEPFGRVIIEGMACGRAVVAVQDGGAAELFEDGVNALGCPPCEPEALACILVRLIDAPDLRRQLGDAGRAATLARFDRSSLAKRWLPVYQGESSRNDETRGCEDVSDQ
jgi:glycosyltransferase involved in cell wall biosynthesis